MLFLVLVTSTKHYWVVSAERRRDKSLVVREIQQNREFLEALVGKKLQHLSYPSGVWSKQRYGREKGTTLSERNTLARAGRTPR